MASNEFLDTASNVIMVVPLTSTIRNYFAEIVIEPDTENGLATPSAAQCQHVRSLAEHRIVDIGGRLDVELLYAIRFTIGDLLDLD